MLHLGFIEIILKKKNNIKILKKNLSNFRLTLDYEKDYVNFKQNTVALKNIATNKNFEKYLNRKLFK